MKTHYNRPNWPAPINVNAYMTTRVGGCSVGKYAGFNLADHVGDNPAHVIKNRAQLIEDLQLPNEPVWLNQTHSTIVVNAADVQKKPNADASFTTEPNIICIVQTGDCLPILLCDTQGTFVAAIHAGWRGLAAGIIENTVKHFQAPKEKLMAWFGAAIDAKVYEVGAEVREVFMNFSPSATAAFQAKPNNKYMADIYLLARQRLHALGITQIFGGDECTFTQADRYYSARRDKVTGRMASLIWLGEN